MSQEHSARSPFRDGFAALLHEPVLLPAELVWRWCFGLSALTLAVLSIAFFLDSLQLSRADEFLIRTWQPQLLHTALRHIFRGSLARFLAEQTVLLLGVTLLWAGAATAGRAATLRRLVAMFSADEEPQPMEWHFASIFVLQLLRALWSLIAAAVAAGFFLYGIVMVQDEHPLRAALALSFGIGLAGFFGIVLNWYFSVAPLFCIRNGGGAMAALDQTAEFSERHAGRLFLFGTGFFTLRLIWAAIMGLIFLAPLNLVDYIGVEWMLFLMSLAVVIYFAGADFLYLARLGAYASLAEDDAHPIADVISAEVITPPDILPLVGLA